MERRLKIVGIGTGKLAHQLYPAIQSAGHEIIQVFNRSAKSKEWVENELKTSFTDDPRHLNRGAEIYIMAVSDDAISSLAPELSFPNSFFVHCSGATAISEINGYGVRRGVFYPLLSFDGKESINWKQTPLLIEAQDQGDKVNLEILANSLSKKVFEMDSRQRGLLHLSAVLSQNFSNHLIALAQQVCNESKVPFDLLLPLLDESNKRIQNGEEATDVQTGPAIRKDAKTIDRHLYLLREWPEIREVYRILTASIQNYHNKK